MKKVTSSFAAGAIALVFAVLGYQTALLIHYSAVTAITAHRDFPDTVYVSRSGTEFPEMETGQHFSRLCPPADRSSGRGPSLAMGGREGACSEHVDARGLSSRALARRERRSGKDVDREMKGDSARSNAPHSPVARQNSPHSPVARQIRESVPPRRVESFRFDPNTASAEDLLRLGFSPKQAQSIRNYVEKGGRFRRKSDFAKSYVVSDSVYQRLAPYIDIPRLDINSADSAAFDALPGIGGYFARKMVEHRQALGGYSYPEQLMDIYHFDREKYDALSDLITVGPHAPYRLWQLPADSLRLHPYIRSASIARSIVLYRTHNPVEACTVDGLAKAGIILGENAEKLSRCLIAEP